MKIQRIVVGIDFSPYSEVARLRAFELALAKDAELIVVHSVQDSAYQAQKIWPLSSMKFSEFLAEERRATNQHMETLAKESRAAGAEVRVEISESEPDVALFESVERNKADLLVIGTHGRTGFDRLMLARTAERVARNSPCSVLVVRASTTSAPMLARILVPTDFSTSANNALEAARSLVVDDGSIKLLHCWQTPYFATGNHGQVEPALSLEPEVAQAVRKEGIALVEKYRSPHVQMEFDDIKSTPAKGIHKELATQRPYTLVVMGSHGRRRLGRLMLGSTVEATVRHANCSVLVVRDQEQTDTI